MYCNIKYVINIIESSHWLYECQIIFVKYYNYIFYSTGSGTSVFIPNVRRLDSGAFLCIASNGIPPSPSQKITVTVLCKYIPTTIKYIES